ncbi:MAG: polyprenyl synthetase family protein [Candidatus Nealsonbacteria bacterium]|nr:polyprenyl synthetase family protein [Candidatus Nealsonbacteria bacterium]
MVDTQSPTFSQHAQRLHGRIDAALQSRCALADGCPANLLAAIRYSLLAPGKRLRPILVLAAAEACDGSIDAAMPAACAVEMVHAYSLVHDDLPAMDDDDLRRGQPTCHKQFDEATAILVGDALLTMAFETLAGQVEPPEVAAACCAALARAAGPCRMVGGQADDVAGPGTDGSVEQLDWLHRRKTGAMIRVSLKLGALTAGASAMQMEALDRYGDRLGLAFQITDDLLDVTGDDAAAGKRVGKDARQGKLTFPGLLGIDESARRAERLIGEACEALLPLGSGTELLNALARYVLERNR